VSASNSDPALDLEASLREVTERFLARADRPAPSNLADSIRYSLYAPGKRIRPRLLLAAAKMLGLPLEAALPPALALEMYHCFSLIHDDLPCMDDDDFRRGRPSNHKQFSEGLALLAGDALLALSSEVFSESFRASPDPERFFRAFRRFAGITGAGGVIGGQAAEMMLDERSTLDDLMKMHRLKTGALFSGAILIPMDLAGIAETSAEGQLLADFASELGLGFQIADDLEDAGPEGQNQEDSKSILRHLPVAEVRSRFSASLASASDALTRSFGAPSAPLTAIAQEVVKRLR
jgi:geranylgeranyl diphosphate synthase type II